MAYKLLIPVLLVCMQVLGAAQNDSNKDGNGNAGGGRVGVRTTSRPATQGRDDSNRPLYLTGKVVMLGGAALPNMVQVQLKCNGSVRATVYSSTEGNFSFTLGGTVAKSGSMDASLGGPTFSTGGISLSSERDADRFRRAGLGTDLGFGRVDLSTCICEALLSGYENQPVHLGIRSVFDSPDIGELTLYPLGEIKGTTVSLNSLNAPKKAVKLLEKANKELEKEKVDYKKVEKNLLKATEAFPAYAEAWQLLGEVRLLQGNESEARAALQEAMETDPDFVPPYLVMGELEIHANRWEKAAEFMKKAIDLNPYLAHAHYFFALANYYLKEDQKAENSLLRVQQSPDAGLFPASHYLLGGIYEDRGDYQAAALEFRRFLGTDPPEELATEVRSKIGNWVSRGMVEEISQ